MKGLNVAFNIIYLAISTHPPQCSKLPVFCAVLVRERFEEDVTTKVQKLQECKPA